MRLFRQKPIKSFLIHPFSWRFYVFTVILFASIYIAVGVIENKWVEGLMVLAFIIPFFIVITILNKVLRQRFYEDGLATAHNEMIYFKDITAIYIVKLKEWKYVRRRLYVCLELSNTPFRYNPVAVKDIDGFVKYLRSHCPQAEYHKAMRTLKYKDPIWVWGDE